MSTIIKKFILIIFAFLLGAQAPIKADVQVANQPQTQQRSWAWPSAYFAATSILAVGIAWLGLKWAKKKVNDRKQAQQTLKDVAKTPAQHEATPAPENSVANNDSVDNQMLNPTPRAKAHDTQRRQSFSQNKSFWYTSDKYKGVRHTVPIIDATEHVRRGTWSYEQAMHTLTTPQEKLDWISTFPHKINEDNVNNATSDQNTALHLAVQANKFNIVKLLVEKKADVNPENGLGETPLHYVNYISTNNDDAKMDANIIVDYLVANNAELTKKCLCGHTPLQLAQALQNHTVVFALKRHATNLPKPPTSALQLPQPPTREEFEQSRAERF